MSLVEIENLSHADLKAQRDTLISAAAKAPAVELAARYVQARTDAKARDEKLAEQGATITALTVGNAAMQAKTSELQAAMANADREIAFGQKCLGEAQQALNAKEKELASETARANRLKAEAARNFSALSTAEKALKDAMAARELEAVDKG